MSLVDVLIVFAGSIAAGAINVVVGSGTLITFPLLVAVGLPPVTANVSNTIGLVPGSLLGAWGYRAELKRSRLRVKLLVVPSSFGGLLGAFLLLVLPSSTFDAVVPCFILIALVLVIAQPWLARFVAIRAVGITRASYSFVLLISLFICGVYGGYFGAAQGVIILALLGLVAHEDLQQANGVKNVLAGCTNLIAGLVFALAAPVNWQAAAIVGIGSSIGGMTGAKIGKRLSRSTLRGVIVVVGCLALLRFVL